MVRSGKTIKKEKEEEQREAMTREKGDAGRWGRGRRGSGGRESDGGNVGEDRRKIGRGKATRRGGSSQRPESGVSATSTSGADAAGDLNAFIYTCPIGGLIAGVSSGLLGGIIGSGTSVPLRDGD